MKNIFWLSVISFATISGVFGVAYILFPDKLTTDLATVLSLSLLSAVFVFIIYIPYLSSKNNTNTSQIGSIGVNGFFSFILLLISFIAVYQALIGNSKIALAINVVTICGFFVSISTIKITTNLLDKFSNSIDFKSSQPIWSNQLLVIANNCPDHKIKSVISKFSDDSIYLSRDIGPEPTDINMKIDDAIKTLEIFSIESNLDAVNIQLIQIKNLFSQRENQLKSHRSKV